MPPNQPTAVALIPARSGSKRLPNKNVKDLGGRPLLAYTIAAAIQSGIFESVIVSTDSEQYADIAHHYGADSVLMRPPEYATDTSPDIEWVRHALEVLRSGEDYGEPTYDAFSILRVTSPFRDAESIRAAWERWCEKGERYHSLRAVQKTPIHPYKTFRYHAASSTLQPLMADAPDWWKDGAPGHSRQYASLPPLFAQTSSLEIAHTRTVFEMDSIAGDLILPFFCEGWAGLSIDQPEDWLLAEALIASGDARLPVIPQEV